jgi:hypothetical protein
MTPLFYFRDFQNRLSFRLRSQIRFHKNPKTDELVKPGVLQLQDELGDFLDLFHWGNFGLSLSSTNPLLVGDVGARDFSFAPVFDRHFRNKGIREVEVHGFEVDAYRRYTNLCSRADYGRAFAGRIPKGYYHAMDFLDWDLPLDVIFLLHPFVTPEPPLRWGLPLSVYRPQILFEHCMRILKTRTGILLLSNPTLKEFEISLNLAEKAGFTVKQKVLWKATSTNPAHQKPRFGAWLSCYP